MIQRRFMQEWLLTRIAFLKLIIFRYRSPQANNDDEICPVIFPFSSHQNLSLIPSVVPWQTISSVIYYKVVLLRKAKSIVLTVN